MSDVSDLDILLLAADLADRESMRTWRSNDLDVEIKADGSPVSAADKLIERRLRELIAEHRPDDRVLGEEEGDIGAGARCWVLDPIDGTGSYVPGRRAWGSLIAPEVAARPVAGMVTMPALGRRWWGTLGDGAWSTPEPGATPRPIGVSTQSDGKQMRWSSGPIVDELDADERERIAHIGDLDNYVPMSEWTTYPALMVADGSLDLAVHFGMHWDHAALAAVVVSAGGKIAFDRPASHERRFAAVFTNGRVTA